MLKPAASILGSGWILSCAVQEWPELCRPRHLLTSPGIYAFPAGLIALTAVSSPRAAPEWFFLLCLCFAALGLLLAFLTEADLAITVRRYRAEAISFEEAAQGMARAARAMFRAAQMVAIALAIGVGAGLALAFPGLAILAAMLTPVLAIAIAALPGAVAVPRLADAALALVVPVNALSPGADGEDRFRMGWRFEARMGAVRAALADRSAPLPSEARDLIKALDGGGMVRPPITQLSVVSVAGAAFAGAWSERGRRYGFSSSTVRLAGGGFDAVGCSFCFAASRGSLATAFSVRRNSARSGVGGRSHRRERHPWTRSG